MVKIVSSMYRLVEPNVWLREDAGKAETEVGYSQSCVLLLRRLLQP